MAIDSTKSFEVTDGITLTEGPIWIGSGTVDPSASSGISAPVGSVYQRNDGVKWVKTGSGDTAWTSEENSKLTCLMIMFGTPGGSVLATGVQNAALQIHFGCTIEAITLVAHESGSIVLDIWKDTYGNVPPTVADTITASAKPTLSSELKYTDSTLTGWTKTITAGDTLIFNIDSVSTITSLTVSIKLKKA